MLIMAAALAPFLLLGVALIAVDRLTARRKRLARHFHLEQQATRKERQQEISRRRGN